MDAIVELAKMFKDRDNKSPMGVLVGKVETPPPTSRIRVNEFILLENKHLVFSAHLLSGYKRDYKGKVNIPSHNISSNFNGEIEWEDTIEQGDEVILIPAANEKLYYVVDKAVRG